MIIPIVPIKQNSSRDGCAYACLQMIFTFHGYNVTNEEIDAFVVKDKENATFNTELARFVVSKGFIAECYAYNLYFTDPGDAALSKNALIEKLKREKNKIYFDEWYKELIHSTILCIEQGVDYIISKPSFQQIASYLNHGMPLIASVSYAALYNKQADPFIGHDIVLCGIENDTIFFIDPEFGIKDKTSIDNLMFAMASRKAIAASSYLLAIKKR